MKGKWSYVLTFVVGAAVGIGAWECTDSMRGVSASVEQTAEQKVDAADATQPEESQIVDDVEYDEAEMPAFPGGDDALVTYIQDNIKYPSEAEKNGVEGRILVKFVVTKDGKVTNVRVPDEEADADLAAEAMRLVKAMPNWKPGRQAGQNADVPLQLPINFRLK